MNTVVQFCIDIIFTVWFINLLCDLLFDIDIIESVRKIVKKYFK